MNLIQKGEGPVYDSLLAGSEIPILTTQVTLAAGQGVLPRGSVLGIAEADGTGRLCDKNAIDGSQIAKFILAEETDTTDTADTAEFVKAVCYKSGMFHRNSLHFGENSTAGDHELELRMLNIHLREEY